MSTLTDDDLAQLLDEAASSYDVPEHGPEEVLATLGTLSVEKPLYRRRWVQLSSVAAVTVLAFVLAAAVGGGPTSGSSNDMAAPAARRDMGAGEVAKTDSYGKVAGVGGATGGTTGGGVADQRAALDSTQAGSAAGLSYGAMAPPAAVPAPAPVSAQLPRMGTNSAGVKSAPEAPQLGAPVADGSASRVVKTGNIALIVKDGRVTPTITAVQNVAKGLGGYIASTNAEESGRTPSGEVSLRIPVAHFEDAVARVRGLDAKVLSSSTSGADVTAQYADMEAQLRTLKAARERFLAILSRTKTIGEVLTVQQRVDQVSGQIDQIEGQKKLLASQSDLSTLTVSVSENDDPVVTVNRDPRSGLSQALHDAKDGFVTGVEALIRHSGRALLWLICLAVLAVAIRGGYRVARRRLV